MPAEIKITLDESGSSSGGGGGRGGMVGDYDADTWAMMERDWKETEAEDKRWKDQVEKVAKQARDAEEADRKRAEKAADAAAKEEEREAKSYRKFIDKLDKEEEKAARAAAKEEEREANRAEKAARDAAKEEARGEERARREYDAKVRSRLALGVGAAGAAGTAMMGLPQNQIMPGIQAATNVAAQGLSQLGPKGAAAAAALQIGTMAVTAFTKTVDGFVARGRELAGLNGQLAGASAYADITRMKADIREADELGPQLAQLIENQAKTEATIREILLPIKSFVLDILNDVLETGMETAVSMLEALKDIAQALGAGANVVGKLEDMVRRIRDIMEGGADVDPIGVWLRDLGAFVPPPAAAPAPAAVPLGIPGGI